MRLINRVVPASMAAILSFSAVAYASPEPASQNAECSVGTVDTVKISAGDEQRAITLSKEKLDKASYAGDVEWDKAEVQAASDGKAWVLVPVDTGSDKSLKFHRIAVDLDENEAVNVQTYEISEPDSETGEAQASMLSDGTLLWEGTVNSEGEVSTSPTSPMNPAYRSRGFCEWGVGALCGTGGGAGCYGACIALGLANGLAGLGCAAVCGLISSVGCTAATNQICGD